jgi:chitinase
MRRRERMPVPKTPPRRRMLAAAVLLGVCAGLGVFGLTPGLNEPGGAARAEAGALTAVYVYDGSKTAYRDEDAEKIDQMFYAFALIKNGRVSVSHWKRIKKFQAYIQKHPSITPILSVGGWGADGFSQAAATAEGRAAFAADVLTVMEKYGFLGVDIDWEYPGSSAGGIESSPNDRENFTLLLAELRSALDALTAGDGVPRRLCIAVSGSPGLIPNLECEKIGEIVDQINLMTYDLQQPDTASHHSALYASQAGAISADVCVRAYEAAGVPAAKLLLGAAFYGHRWTTKTADPLYQPAKYKDTLSYTAILKLIKKTPDAVFYDEAAQAPYFYNGKVFVSYDDERSIARKALYAEENGLLGLFAWEYGSDSSGALVAAIRP